MSSDVFLKRTLNRSFYYGASSVLGKVVGFLMLPIYTTYLTPTDYGVAGFLVLYVSLVQIVLGGKLEHAISKFYYDKSETSTLPEIINSATIFTFLVAIIPLALSQIYAQELSALLFDTSEYSLALMAISFNIYFGTMELYGLHYIRIVDRPKLYLALNVLKLFTQLSINIIFVVILEMGVFGVALSSALAAVLISFITYTIMYLDEKCFDVNLELLIRLVKFSAPLWVSGFMGLYTGSIYQVFLKQYTGLHELGIYNLALTFGTLVGVLIWNPFFSFWSAERFKIADQDNAKDLYRNTLYTVGLISLIFCFGISVFADPVIRIMANPEFHDAANIVLPLTIFNVSMYIGWYLNFSFLKESRNGEIVKNNLFYAVILTVVFFITIPQWGLLGAAYGSMFAGILNVHYIHLRAKVFYNINLSISKIYLMIFLAFVIGKTFTNISIQNESPLDAAINSTVFSVLLFGAGLLFTYIVFPNPTKLLIKKIKTLA